VGDGFLEARRYARAFGRDARALYARNHMHRCMETCYKYVGGGKPGDKNRVCRFGFCHTFGSMSFKRRWPNQKCRRGDNCPFKDQPFHESVQRCDENCVEQSWAKCKTPCEFIHPRHCPADVMGCEEKKWLRRGKALVLPGDAELGDPRKRFLPKVSMDVTGGRVGRVQVLRYHPICGSSNPAGQVFLRGNWDVTCCDHVFVMATKRTVVTYRKKRPAVELPEKGQKDRGVLKRRNLSQIKGGGGDET